jgi:hypothetical protein
MRIILLPNGVDWRIWPLCVGDFLGKHVFVQHEKPIGFFFIKKSGMYKLVKNSLQSHILSAGKKTGFLNN